MSIFSCVGDTGSGKTCYETWYSHYRYDKGYTIASNYELKYLDYILLESHDDLLNIGNRDIELLLYSLDENWINCDSRRSNSLLNQQSTKFGMQHRKLHADIFQSAQTWKQIDVRFRSQTMIWYEPQILVRECLRCNTIAKNSDFGVFEECPECGSMKQAKPLVLQINYTIATGKVRRGNYIIPMQYEFEHGYIDIPESYSTFEIVKGFEIQIKDLIKTYPNIINKYVPISKLSGKALIALLKYKERITEEDITPLSELIMGFRAMENIKEVSDKELNSIPEIQQLITV